MNDTTIQVFIDNGATSSILLLSTYKKHPILQKYPTTKSTTPIHIGGGTIKLHFWIELPSILENQTIQIKTSKQFSLVTQSVHMTSCSEEHL